MAKIMARKDDTFTSVVVELSYEEAKAIFDITELIAGDPVSSRRRIFDKLGSDFATLFAKDGEDTSDTTSDSRIWFETAE